MNLEVAYSFTTDSFVMALMRFISRRGHLREIYNDNGSHSAEAEHELRKYLQGWAQEHIRSEPLEKRID